MQVWEISAQQRTVYGEVGFAFLALLMTGLDHGWRPCPLDWCNAPDSAATRRYGK
jgi:hypothetical protein